MMVNEIMRGSLRRTRNVADRKPGSCVLFHLIRELVHNHLDIRASYNTITSVVNVGCSHVRMIRHIHYPDAASAPTLHPSKMGEKT